MVYVIREDGWVKFSRRGAHYERYEAKAQVLRSPLTGLSYE